MELIIALLLAAPIVLFIRIKSNCELSRNKINKWAIKNEYEIIDLKIKFLSLFSNNFGRFLKKSYLIKLKDCKRNIIIKAELNCRFSAIDSNYEAIVFYELK